MSIAEVKLEPEVRLRLVKGFDIGSQTFINEGCEPSDMLLVSPTPLKYFSKLMKSFDVDGEAILRKYHLDSELITLPRMLIPFEAFINVLSEAVSLTGCDHIGLLLAKTGYLESVDLVLLAMQSETVGDALRNFNKYISSHGQIYTLRLDVSRGVACWKCYCSEYPDKDMRPMYDLIAGCFAEMMRYILSDDLDIHSMAMGPHTVEKKKIYRDELGINCLFDTAYVGVFFDESLLGKPLVNNSTLKNIMLSYFDNEPVLQNNNLLSKVNHFIEVLLPTGRCSIDGVATILGMHQRTLQKKLKDEGVSFKNVLGDIRQKKSCYYLSKTQLTVDEIAAALGYNDTSNFRHAFKRWLNDTPINWRNSNVVE